MSEPGSSFWPTPRNNTGPSKDAKHLSLDAACLWPTPSASEYGTNQGGAAGRVGPVRESLNTLGRNWPTPMAGAATRTAQGGIQLWPTPRAEERGQHNSQDEGVALSKAVQNWPTPTTMDAHRDGQSRAEQSGQHALSLHHAAKMWPTPTATGSKASGANYPSTATHQQGTTLTDAAVRQWATPTASENANRTTKTRPSEADGHGATLAGQANERLWAPTPPHAPTQPPGPPSRAQGRTLNPRFVEWLMGWPIGWSDCGSAAMESYRTWLLARGACCSTASSGEES
jgi:hypothetical protein